MGALLADGEFYVGFGWGVFWGGGHVWLHLYDFLERNVFVMDIGNLRSQIDTIDSELTKLFEQRMVIAADVAVYKKEKGLPIFQPEREVQVIEKNVSKLTNKELSPELRQFYKSLMNISKSYQLKKMENKYIVGFGGTVGSFGYTALKEYFINELTEGSLEIKAYKDHEDVFEALEKGEIEYGVLPIENSTTGSINTNYDGLLAYDFHIIGEHFVRAEQNLMSIKGAELSGIKKVYSHPQGFEQSTKFLSRYKDWELIPYHNTAISASFVREQNNAEYAAIAGREAAYVNGLEILAENINNNKKNFTRFMVISKDLSYDYSCNKISIVFSIQHKVGTLAWVMDCVSKNGINMLNLQSRPNQEKPWEYYFYLDVEGNLNDENIKVALECIKENSLYFKILGCYKREVY